MKIKPDMVFPALVSLIGLVFLGIICVFGPGAVIVSLIWSCPAFPRPALPLGDLFWRCTEVWLLALLVIGIVTELDAISWRRRRTGGRS